MSNPKSRSKDLAQVGLAARRAATDILAKTIDDGRTLESELDASAVQPAYRLLIAKDRALIRAILGTALRRRGQIEDALARLIDKPLPPKARRVEHILHIAATQILFMDVADHAAVSLAVTLTSSETRLRPWKNLVNGVLRNLIRQRDTILAEQDAPRLNTPYWLWQRWCRHYGDEAARKIAEMHLVEPSLDLTVRGDLQHWAQTLNATPVAGNSIRLAAKGNVEHLDGYDDGAWWVQDAAAAFPARFLGNVSGKRVADLCAAPGGKTAQLAAAGANVTAVDVAPERNKRVSENLSRLGLGAEIVTADLLKWSPAERFDAIVLDAPCTATGTIRRHPDIGLRKRAGDIATIAKTQKQMLERAVSWLKPGGLLVYCTCSLEPEEGEDIIAGAIGAALPVERLPIMPDEVDGHADVLSDAGDFRSLPFHAAGETPRLSGLDGFYAARLRRK